MPISVKKLIVPFYINTVNVDNQNGHIPYTLWSANSSTLFYPPIKLPSLHVARFSGLFTGEVSSCVPLIFRNSRETGSLLSFGQHACMKLS